MYGLLGQLPRKDSILVDKMRCQNNALNLFAHTSVSHNQLVNLRRNCNVGRHEFLSIGLCVSALFLHLVTSVKNIYSRSYKIVPHASKQAE